MWIEIRLTNAHFANLTYKKSSKLIFAWLDRRPFKVERYLWGVERRDKFGEPFPEHIHYKCEINDPDVKKNTLQNSFRDFMASYGYVLKGVKHYAMMLTHEPDDIDRWWRYALKENLDCGHSNDLAEFVAEQRPQAINERELQIKRNREARDKYLDKESFKGKMYKEIYDYFEEKCDGQHHKYKFLILMIKYYKSKNKVCPFSKLEHYWDDYNICVGNTSPEAWVERYMRQNGCPQFELPPEPNAGAGQAPDDDSDDEWFPNGNPWIEDEDPQ